MRGSVNSYVLFYSLTRRWKLALLEVNYFARRGFGCGSRRIQSEASQPPPWFSWRILSASCKHARSPSRAPPSQRGETIADGLRCFPMTSPSRTLQPPGTLCTYSDTCKVSRHVYASIVSAVRQTHTICSLHSIVNNNSMCNCSSQ